ncbi:MAG: alpha/beta hydrolase [Fimbriiglobus sp.]
MEAMLVLALWTTKAPAAVGDSKTDVPSLTVFAAPKETATGAAVVICPGGGYGYLADDHEGRQIARFFNKLGVHAFVLKYRIVAKDRPGPLAPAPKLDVLRAIRTVRAKAADFGIDPARVGLVGFSAGGHLASTGGTHFDAGDKTAEDPIERVSSRPDFLVLGYPVISMEDGVTHGGSRKNLLGDKPTPEQIAEYSNEKRVTKDTPPTFIFQTDEDKAVPAENAVRFYLALRANKVPAELLIYEKGQHGVGLGSERSKYVTSWPDRLTAWLKLRGVLDAKK